VARDNPTGHRGQTHVCLNEPTSHLVLRFALGAISLAGARLVAELHDPESATSPPAEPPVRLRHHLVGAALLGSSAIASIAAVTRVRWTARAGWLAGWCGRFLAASRLGLRFDRELRRLVARAATTAGRWAEIGRAEELAGRRLAHAVAERAYEDAVARLGRSPELRHLVAQESAGLTRSAVGELRERCARADDRIESTVRRLRRRR